MQNAQELTAARDSSSPFLNSTEAARFLGLRKSTLEAWRCRGGGPAFVKFGRAVRYRLTDLNDWIESRTRHNTIGGAE